MLINITYKMGMHPIHSRFLVIDTLFLPRPLMVNADYKGFDVSAFGGMGGEKAPQKSLEPVNAGKDFMTVERKENYLNKTDNIPKFNNMEVNPADYQKDFLNGFKEIYQLLMKEKGFLLSKDSPLIHFKNVETRFIVRNTAEYTKLLFESFHPLIFHNQSERSKHFNWLYREDSLGFINKFLPSELKDLYEGNIPLFTILSDGSKVLDSYSNIIDVKVYQSGYQRMMDHLKNNIHKRDLNIQMSCIQQSLIAYQSNVKTKKSIARSKIKKIEHFAYLDFNQIKKTSLEISKFQLDLLLRHEIMDKDKICWTNIDYVDYHVWRPNRVATDLYNGLAGIILTFAYAEQIFNNSQYGDRSRIGFHYLKRIIRQLKNLDKITLGAFSGLTGILYCFSKLYTLWKDPIVLEEIYFLLTIIKKVNATNEHYDLIDGAAGLLAVFNTCRDVIPNSIFIEETQLALNYILNHYPEPSQLPSNIQPHKFLKSLLGFAHGTAGIAWALRAYEDEDPRIKSWVEQALLYERSAFEDNDHRWPDFRSLNKDQNQNSIDAWCHGSVGIALSRLDLYDQYRNDFKIREEIDFSIDLTNQTQIDTLNLCHGNGGRLELLLTAYLMGLIKEDKYYHYLNQFIHSIKRTHKLKYDTLGKIFLPGLMTGAAGIAYQLMRIYNPKSLPSLLLLK